MTTSLQILKRLYEANSVGLADHELAVLCPKICISTVRGTRKDLERNKLCRRTDIMKQTVTGCYGSVYVITDLGKQYIDNGRSLPSKQVPITDISLLRSIIRKLNKGYGFQCSQIQGEDNYFAGFFNDKSIQCRECDAPLFAEEEVGIGATPEEAILKALAK